MSGSNLTLTTEMESAARERLAQCYERDAALYQNLADSPINDHLVVFFGTLAKDYRSRAAALRSGGKK